MKMMCWGKYPDIGSCTNFAERFFVSLIPESLGMTPRNRAVCKECAIKLRFDWYVTNGTVTEVKESDWKR